MRPPRKLKKQAGRAPLSSPEKLSRAPQSKMSQLFKLKNQAGRALLSSLEKSYRPMCCVLNYDTIERKTIQMS